MRRVSALLAAMVATTAASAEHVGRTLTAEDLVSIVDIGIPNTPGASLAVSPDGRYVAFETRRADIESNRIVIRWNVLPLEGDLQAIDAGDGGEPQLWLSRGQPAGYFVPEVPQWSPDSTAIAYRVQRDGEVQLWLSAPDDATRGSDGESKTLGGARSQSRASSTRAASTPSRWRQRQLTHNAANVNQFRWSSDARTILYAVYRPRDEIRADLEREALRGYLYDERFAPYTSREPLPAKPDPRDRRIWAYDVAHDVERLATADEIRTFEAPPPTSAARAADLRPDDTLGLNPPRTVVWNSLVCRLAPCHGPIEGVWFNTDAERVYFLRYVNPNEYGAMRLYAWNPATDLLQSIWTTSGLLKGCAPTRTVLICGYETATHPRRILAIDLTSGDRKVLFDPNPDFDQFAFGEVSELHWKDREGRPGFGHVVKPVGFDPGRKYPAVVVSYRSRGFLRGGSGDEYPIHLFANHGFVVLSFHRIEDRELMATSKTFDELEVRGWIGLRDRRLALSELESGIDDLIGQGFVDPRRIGISGLSEGGEGASFALIHAPERFAAASVSWTLYNPMLYPLKGPKFQPMFERWGLGLEPEDPDLLTDAEFQPRAGQRAGALSGGPAPQSNWHEVSIAFNAARIRAPLLIQVADTEMLPETHTVVALQKHGKPVEMVVFPNETHLKWQPTHRLAAYRRNLQWFLFWLQGVEDREPVDSHQYARWRKLREQACSQNSAASKDKNGLNCPCRKGSPCTSTASTFARSTSPCFAS